VTERFIQIRKVILWQAARARSAYLVQVTEGEGKSNIVILPVH
jgi:hypothetical protein